MTDLHRKTLALTLAGSAMLALSGCNLSTESTFEAAQAAYDKGEYRIANAHLLDLEKNDLLDDRGRLLQMQLMLDLGEGERAQSAIERLPDSVLSGAERRIATAHANILQGYPNRVAETYEDLPEAEYTEQDFRMVLWALRELDDLEDFTAGMDAALERHPNSPHLNAMAANALFDLGLPDEGIPFAIKAFEANAENYEVRLAVGRAAIAEDELEIALEHYTRASELRPDHAVPLANMVGLQLDLGDTEAAGETLNRALRQHGGFPFLQWQAARYHLESGDVNAARAAMEMARRSFANEAEFMLLVGRIEEAAGNTALALDSYRRFMAVEGENAEIAARIAKLEAASS